jgi:hypothetical protein
MENWKKYTHLTLLVITVFVAVRVGLIFKARNETPRELPSPPVDPVRAQQIADDVYLPQVYAYDLESSSRAMRGKTVWVRAGNQMMPLGYHPASKNADFREEKGVLRPLERLDVTGVFLQNSPKGSRQLMMSFRRFSANDQEQAVSVGVVRGNTYQIYINEVFFLKDPHLAYKHWPADVWKAIDAHEVRPGMSELQVALALGSGAVSEGGDYGNRTLEYGNGGKPMTIRFMDGAAAVISAGGK